MKSRSDGFPARTLVTALALVWSATIGVIAASRDPQTPQPRGARASHSATAATGTAAQAPSDQAQANNFVGEETCVTCHEAEGKSIHATLHGKAQNVRTPAGRTAGQSCEVCHGPGQKHADSGSKEDIRRFDRLNARDANATCLTCHNKGPHADWQGSMHDARNVACASCHSVHAPKSERFQLKTATATETCESCHKQEAMKIRKSGHMPVREGKMDCTSCHTPHGSNNVRMLKVGNSINEACASCHAEKRGPFLWEHAAGRENCASCHDPHGSNNDRMLVAKAPMLCQRCHVSSRHPATIYDATQVANGSNRVVGRACVNCHAQIHGSNHPAGAQFLR
ncbi:MAG TPA: DmsE family decaheme c-type cytochrome [Vicinamibacterales bacterium]|nr:DmsE family decaheme c-type cytochrome [Vicinamibacterales bacterium]